MAGPPVARTAALGTRKAQGHGRKREDIKRRRYPSTLKVSCLVSQSQTGVAFPTWSRHALPTVALSPGPRPSNAHFRPLTLVGGAPTSCDAGVGSAGAWAAWTPNPSPRVPRLGHFPLQVLRRSPFSAHPHEVSRATLALRGWNLPCFPWASWRPS